jgi:ribosome maturation factor RimP
MTDDTKVRGKLTAVDERQLTLELPAVRKQPATVRTIAMSDIREAKVEVTF